MRLAVISGGILAGATLALIAVNAVSAQQAVVLAVAAVVLIAGGLAARLMPRRSRR